MQRLLDYGALLAKWNRVYNLTAIRRPEQIVTHHLLDSLAVAPYVVGPRVADIGTGAGLPGIPLALLHPDWTVALVESNHKKATFLEQARIELGLGNVQVVTERVEGWQPVHGFDTVICRAFSDLAEFVRLAGHLCTSQGGFPGGAGGGRLLAMKGVYPFEEVAQLPSGWVVDQVVALKVPGLDAERHLVVIKKS